MVARDIAAPQFLAMDGARMPGRSGASGIGSCDHPGGTRGRGGAVLGRGGGGSGPGVSLVVASNVVPWKALVGQLDAQFRAARAGQVHVEGFLHGNRGDRQAADEGAPLAKIV
jgi:hypothetical protein